MADRLIKRLLALERCQAADRPLGGVVTFGRNETPEQALERARHEGVTGTVLLVPEMMPPEEWEAMMSQVSVEKG